MTSFEKLRPTAKMLALIDVYGGVNGASTAWGIPYNCLRRFVEGRGGMTIDTMQKIMDVVRLSYDDLVTKDGE